MSRPTLKPRHWLNATWRSDWREKGLIGLCRSVRSPWASSWRVQVWGIDVSFGYMMLYDEERAGC